MRSKLLSGMIVATSVATASWAQTDDEAAAENAFRMAQDFASCAGYWTFFSEVERVLGNQASADNARNISNGARLSSAYMLSLRQRLVAPNARPKPYGEWFPFIDGIAETTSTAMASALEAKQMLVIEQKGIRCSSLSVTSEEIVANIRRDALDR